MKQLTYHTGEPILEGDVVKIGNMDAVVTTVITQDSPWWDDYGGVSFEGPVFARMRMETVNEDLVLVRRKLK